MLYADRGLRALSEDGRVLVCSQSLAKEIPNLLVHPALIILFDLSLAPALRKIIRTLSPSRREKILISVLMAPAQTTMVESGKSEINKIPPHNVRVEED
jgi:hypothetical protein